MIHKNRGNRRFVTKTKALRKEKIALQLYGEYGWYGSCRGKYRKRKNPLQLSNVRFKNELQYQ